MVTGFLYRRLSSPIGFLMVGMVITMGVMTGLAADSPQDATFNDSLRQNMTLTAEDLGERESPEEQMLKQHAPGVYNTTNGTLTALTPNFLTMSPAQERAWQSMWVDGINFLLLTFVEIGEAAALWAYHNQSWLPGQWFVWWLQGVTYAGAGAMFYYFRWPRLKRALSGGGHEE